MLKIFNNVDFRLQIWQFGRHSWNIVKSSSETLNRDIYKSIFLRWNIRDPGDVWFKFWFISYLLSIYSHWHLEVLKILKYIWSVSFQVTSSKQCVKRLDRRHFAMMDLYDYNIIYMILWRLCSIKHFVTTHVFRLRRHEKPYSWYVFITFNQKYFLNSVNASGQKLWDTFLGRDNFLII